MGDLVTEAVSGSLCFAGREEFVRILQSNAGPAERTALFAELARLNTLYMIANAGSGHIGSSFSCMDIVSWLYLNEMKAEDLYFSSKGHDAPGLYAVLTALGTLPFDKIHQLRRLGGLPGHPDVHVGGMVTNTGSLGMGISKAKGMAFANKLLGRPGRIYVMTGDGELQEGQIWESLISAANDKVSEITVIVDHNKIQSDYSVERTSSLGDLPAKFRAFGWHTQEADGHDLEALAKALAAAKAETQRPSVIIAHTVKGKGVSFMEGASIDSDVERFQFHSGAPKADDYTRAAQELISRVNELAQLSGISSITYQTVERPAAPPAGDAVRLFPAYTAALLDQAQRNGKIVALDADLVLDMGLEPFRDAFPDRFVECGIAEMDMVSQAGGMALQGLLPVVHSFSCFLSTRPNEQIYNNATEDTKIVYVGGLSGVLPAGPGHSHQSVREISVLGSIPNLVMVEPAHPDEVGPLLDWCLNTHDGPSFLRLVSIPFETRYKPTAGKIVAGRGTVVRQPGEAVIVTSGLVGVSLAMEAAALLDTKGVSCGVIALPFLNIVDRGWLAEVAGASKSIITLDNHYRRYGQGDAIGIALAEQGALNGKSFVRLGLNATPPSGANAEVLEAVGLNAVEIARAAAATLPAR
ncbi:transketolase C-terminal domain-containing protein [Hyphomonas sp.]|uniref:transketolase C-terminal domain-containing protein n=1 Tax=Hyphomonas sp. TaxID=87 RepID=UPI001BCA6926|nr:transketolase C-terminal domain-containing protein [Hyphomonas sp.]